MTNWTVDSSGDGMRLDTWLAARPEIGSRGKAQDAIACGKVFRNGAELTFADAGRRLSTGDTVGFWPDRPGSSRPRSRGIVSARRSLAIVHRDDHIIVVNKPAGWLVEPLPGEDQGEVTLLDLVEDHVRGGARAGPFVVHRIDRDTSGIVLFALTVAARDALKRQFERRTPERAYLAVLNGRPEPASGTWRDRLVWDKERLVQKRAHAQEERAKDAEARYRVVEQFADQALVEDLARDRETKPDPRAGRVARLRARRRTAVPLRPAERRGPRTGIRAAGAARGAPGLRPSGHRPPRRIYRCAAG